MGLGQDMAPLTGPHHAFFLWMIGVKGFWGAGQIAGGCRLRQMGQVGPALQVLNQWLLTTFSFSIGSAIASDTSGGRTDLL